MFNNDSKLLLSILLILMTIFIERVANQTRSVNNNAGTCISSVPPTELNNIYDVIVIAVTALTPQTVGAECS